MDSKSPSKLCGRSSNACRPWSCNQNDVNAFHSPQTPNCTAMHSSNLSTSPCRLIALNESSNQVLEGTESPVKATHFEKHSESNQMPTSNDSSEQDENQATIGQDSRKRKRNVQESNDDAERKEHTTGNIRQEEDLNLEIPREEINDDESLCSDVSSEEVDSEYNLQEDDERDAAVEDIFHMNPPTLKKDYLHKSANREEVRLKADIGDEIAKLLSHDYDPSAAAEYLAKFDIDYQHQLKFAASRKKIKIEKIPREKNTAHRSVSKVGVYMIIAMWKGKIVIVKIGINGDGRRQGDYSLSKGQKYIQLISFYNASDATEKKIDEVFINGIKQLLASDATPIFRKIIYQKALDGGLNFGLRRPLAMRFVETSLTRLAGLENHLWYNANEFSIGDDAMFEERKKMCMDAALFMFQLFEKKLGPNFYLLFCGGRRTWPVKTEFLSSKGGKHIFAQTLLCDWITSCLRHIEHEMEFENTTENIIEVPEYWKNTFENPAAGNHAYTTDYTFEECDKAKDEFKKFGQSLSEQKCSFGISLYNMEAAKYSPGRKNLLDVAVLDHNWEITATIQSNKGPSIHVCDKEGSFLLFTNSTGQVLDPERKRLSVESRVAILCNLQTIHYFISLCKWRGGGGNEQTSDAALHASFVLEVLDLINTPPYHSSLILKSLFVSSDTNLFDGSYGNLTVTRRYTMARPHAYTWRGKFDSKHVYVRGPKSENQLEYVETELAKDGLLQNVRRYSRSYDEFKSHIAMYISLLLDIYQTTDLIEQKELHGKFITQTAYLRDKRYKEGTWNREEHIQLFQAIDHHYGDQPDMLIKKTVDNKIRCLVATAGDKRIATKKRHLIGHLKTLHNRQPTIKDAMLCFKRLMIFHDFLDERADDTYIYCRGGTFSRSAEKGGYLHQGNLKVESIMRKYIPEWKDILPDSQRQGYFLPQIMRDIADEGISYFNYISEEYRIVEMPEEEQEVKMWKKFTDMRLNSARTK